jgi:excinuclease UvrABC ATPase subunit
MGANARSTVGMATDANAMLGVLFSRLGKPHIGSCNAWEVRIFAASGVLDPLTGEHLAAFVGRRPQSVASR